MQLGQVKWLKRASNLIQSNPLDMDRILDFLKIDQIYIIH